MTRVFADEVLLGKLHNLTEPIELCDKTGLVIGRVFPALDPSRYVPWVPDFDEADLRRQEESNEKRYTTAEVLAFLEKL